MRIKLAGGVGEHGRNCFLVQGERLSFLVDCGKMAGAEQPNPYLEPEEIRSLSHVFLTHSHADHTGALPWLEEQGFDGIVAATPETLSQLKQMPQRTISLNEFSPPDGMTLKWGRSGHCTGSVWYHFHLEGRSLLFSGDYTEHSLSYVADPIRDLHADLAVLDSAYGPETRSAPEMRQGFLSEAAKSCGQGKPLVLPVPKYGRGLELALLLHQTWPGLSFYGDAHFIRQLDWLRGDQAWTTADIRDQLSDLTVEPIPESVPETGVLFLSDPQLRDPRDEGLARRWAQFGGLILTGSVEMGTGSFRLQREGYGTFCRIPVHCTDQEMLALERQNIFRQVIPYHSAEHPQQAVWIGL